MFEKQYKEFGKKKVYFFTDLILIVINIIIVFFSYQSKLKFYIEDEKFKYVSHTDSGMIFEVWWGNYYSFSWK